VIGIYKIDGWALAPADVWRRSSGAQRYPAPEPELESPPPGQVETPELGPSLTLTITRLQYLPITVARYRVPAALVQCRFLDHTP